MVSGSYDGSVKLWDVSAKSVSTSMSVQGSVLSVACSSTQSVFFAGTSQNLVAGFDPRCGTSPVYQVSNDAMVNSICCIDEGKQILTGDHNGNLKFWDASTSNCISSVCNSAAAISHISINGSILAVNSYDNIIRVYDRLSMEVLFELIGPKNCNWPIRSSIFTSGELSENFLDDDDNIRSHSVNTCLIASGSADSTVFVFDLTSASQSEQKRLSGRGLYGHKDRVYSVSFHPGRALLASASADSTIRIWK
uniref:Uncharacterized protein n=2 Tax=Spongospora subterranea TaxID=70186 RepID=A0A0H5QI03_9EUKA|eukprot:CRZ00946.1 hypothetical protein [Spongospora subterranea]